MTANTWRIDITFGKESYVAQGHMDPFVELMTDHAGRVCKDGYLASVEIQALVSGPFSNTRIVSTVRLNCDQSRATLERAQELATSQAMEGLRNGWEILQERVAKGHFPGSAQ